MEIVPIDYMLNLLDIFVIIIVVIFLIGAWYDELGGNYLVAVICFQDDAVNGANFNITYHLLDKTERERFESLAGDINTADEKDLLNNIKGSGWAWFNITQPTNNYPSPRTI